MQQFAKVSTGVIQHMARRPGATHQGIQFSLLFLKTVNVEKKKSKNLNSQLNSLPLFVH